MVTSSSPLAARSRLRHTLRTVVPPVLGWLGVTLTVCSLVSIPQVQAGPLSELILFTCKTQKNFQIYSARPDGRDLKRLVNVKSDCREPNLSATNNEIVFTALEAGHWHIYKTPTDGSYIQRITNNRADDHHPAWSPDGKQIVFESNRWGQSELAIMNADGSNVRRITKNQTINRFPIWSPTGKSIAFVSWMHGSSDVFTLSTELDTPPVRQASNYYADVAPCYSPDGSRLVYASRNYFRTYLSIAQQNQITHRLMEGTEHAAFPAWSPDGTEIAFANSEKKQHSIRVISPEDGEWRDFAVIPPAQVYDLVWQSKKLPW